MTIQTHARQEAAITGTIKWYNRKKGFGYIIPDVGGEEVFLHHSAMPRSLQQALDEGDRIMFLVEDRPKGPSAMDVAVLDGSQIPAGGETPQATNGNGHKAAPTSGDTFDDLGLIPDLLRAVREAGYTEPTPIQAQAIPDLLNGRDMLGAAQTGTGKTAAFALPVLQHLAQGSYQNSNGHKKNGRKGPRRPIRALVVTPTRELALQIAESFSAYGKYTTLNNTVIFGGVGQHPQVKKLRQGVDILAATPGRLLDLMGQGHIDLSKVEVLVLDEADRMLDMGFIHDVKRIVKAVPDQRQTLLFSATMPDEIVRLSRSILKDPLRVSVDPEQPTVDAIDQYVYHVAKKQKRALLEHLLQDPAAERVLVFSRTKHGANRIVKNLKKAGIAAEPIHGNKSQGARQQALGKFKKGKIRVLVATDVVARGIDVDDITHVIQYDLSNEPETYVHRIGRTGRAGAEGMALSFCADYERTFLRDIERLIKQKLTVVEDHPFKGR